MYYENLFWYFHAGLGTDLNCTYWYMTSFTVLLLFCAGEFGAVYKGVWKSGGKQVAVAIKTLKVRENAYHNY